MRRVAVDDIGASVRKLLVAAPAYPGGVGGRLTTAFSSPSAGLSSLSGSDAMNNKRKSYRMVLDGKEQAHRAETAVGPAESARLPLGLEAVPDESDPTSLCVREILSGGDSAAGDGAGSVDGTDVTGSIVARIKAKPTAAGSRESVYSVVLERKKGERIGGELMAVKISTHPTRLAAPREVQAVLLRPPSGEDAGGKHHSPENCGWVRIRASI